ncbi:class I SAM-dependent methyltransferase [Siminovitchia sediminis]|uniref:Class I SAM-dependent methyltransferase n=1 Tax=Siminovitchia sediminis TaxID=1274353 RepID=A0ABW4KJ91_9BACI
MEKEKLIRIFDRQAATYAKNNEPVSLKRWRKELIGHAKGEVLELAVGAGANFPYYPPGVKVTAIDFSEEMLNTARQRAAASNTEVDWICADIENFELEPGSFDTVVSTLSFCSYENPLKMMQNIQKWCRPDGSILLLEHGISPSFFIAGAQRILNPLLYKVIGCHQTRDIPKLVKDSGLIVRRSESMWLNMFHFIWAHPGTEPPT